MSLLLAVKLLLVFLLTLGSALVLEKYAKKLNLLAHPGEHRQHLRPTPMVGGLAILIGLVLGNAIFNNDFVRLLPALVLLSAVGAVDDRYTLPSWVRFLAQAVAAYLMIALTGVKLVTLGSLTQGSEMWLGAWSVPMTIFATIGVINAVNMSDGHDGLAGSLVLLVLAALLLFPHAPSGASLIMVAIAALCAFLTLNGRLRRSRARIFMGDAGSTVLGLLLAYLLIQGSQIEGGMHPVTALWLLVLPLIDAVAVLIVRPLNGRSPFSADRIHYHHQLVDRGFSVNNTVIVAAMLQAGFALFGFWAWQQGIAEHLQFNVFLTLFGLYVLNLFWFARTST